MSNHSLSALFIDVRDCYYVLGDNAENSLDSRYCEEPFVKKEKIMAKFQTAVF